MVGALALSGGAFLMHNIDVVAASAKSQSNGGPPVVQITDPKNNSTYSWNSLVNYDVIVTYQGKSTQYQEIPSKEVLLKATYIADLSAIAGKPAPKGQATPAGLLYIANSTCLGCHEFKSKAMGPSFAAIATRFPKSDATINMLSQHIHNGSTGVWGQASMPPQTQFSEAQLHAIVHWIMNHAANPDVNYYVGTQGTFRMNPVGTPSSTGGIILTAQFTSQTPNANPKHAAHGEDTVIVRGR